GAHVVVGQCADDAEIHDCLSQRTQPVIRRPAWGLVGVVGGACSARWQARTIHVLTETSSFAAASSTPRLRLSGRRSEIRAWESPSSGGGGGTGGAGGVTSGSGRGRRSTTTSG